jgi:cytochrome b6-f complex iron-sulfur subunit
MPEDVVSGRGSTRRDLLNVLLGGSLAGLVGILLYPILRFVVPPREEGAETSSVVAATARELPPGTRKLFRFGSQTAIVLRTQTGELRALSAVCTHLQCLVQYRPDLGLIWCACHNGRFDLTGKNVAGPPPRPLEQFTVATRGDDIVVSRKTA